MSRLVLAAWLLLTGCVVEAHRSFAMRFGDADTVQWYAASDDVARMGPFVSEVEAWEHLELTDDEQARTGRVHAEGAHVWPERSQLAPAGTRR